MSDSKWLYDAVAKTVDHDYSTSLRAAMTDERGPSAAAKAWAETYAPPESEAVRDYCAMAFDAGAAAERERQCVWKWDDRFYLSGCGIETPHTRHSIKEEQILFCPYCGGKIVVKEER